MSKESKNIHAARQWYIKNKNLYIFTKNHSFEECLDLIRKNVPNIRLNNYKFLLGSFRLAFCSGYNCKIIYNWLNAIFRDIFDNDLLELFDRNLNSLNSVVKVNDLIKNCIFYNEKSKYENYSPNKYFVLKFNNNEELKKYYKEHPLFDFNLQQGKQVPRYCIVNNQECFRWYSNNGIFYLLIRKDYYLRTKHSLDPTSKSFKSYADSLFFIGYDYKHDKIITITDRNNEFAYGISTRSNLTLSNLEEILKVNVYKMIHNF